MNTFSDATQSTPRRVSIPATLYVLAIVVVGAGWWIDRASLNDQLERLSEQATSREATRPPPDVGAPLVLKQAYFCKTQILEYLTKNKVIGQPLPVYPPIREVADGTFDESQLPGLWEQARAHCPGTKCVGYYFTLDKGGKVDPNLRGPAFFVFTIDGKIAWFDDTVLW
jgi:hypothetical protein